MAGARGRREVTGGSGTEIATLGGGCFWCTEAVLRELRGVRRVTSGYAGGTVTNPSYEDVCTGRTGHAEVVQVEFDGSVLPYADLLRVFFVTHDPTTLNRQGGDVGTQYRSVIFYHSELQRSIALQVRDELERERLWGGRVVTEIVPAGAFYPAEEYHRNYFERNPEKAYCRAVIAPKVAKFRKQFVGRLSAGPGTAKEAPAVGR